MLDSHFLGQLQRKFLAPAQHFTKLVVRNLRNALFGQSLIHHRWIAEALSHKAVIVLGDFDSDQLFKSRIKQAAIEKLDVSGPNGSNEFLAMSKDFQTRVITRVVFHLLRKRRHLWVHLVVVNCFEPSHRRASSLWI